jgi:hypothetical protein
MIVGMKELVLNGADWTTKDDTGSMGRQSLKASDGV